VEKMSRIYMKKLIRAPVIFYFSWESAKMGVSVHSRW
jgi:hypothetical protein